MNSASAAAAAGAAWPASARPAVFLDKDGTLVEDVPFNVDPARLRLLPGVAGALSELSAAGYELVVVTNQSGLALRRFTRAQLVHLQRVLEQRLRDEAGVRLAAFLVCPHAPGADGRPACLCRKPAPGMLLQAARTRGVDLARSWIVGDTLDDVEAGHRAGCRGLLLDSGGETVWRRSPIREPDGVAATWDAVVRLLREAPPAVGAGRGRTFAGAASGADAPAARSPRPPRPDSLPRQGMPS